tara:strand:+ start:3344 stop:3622 length:279 start_codon:yes stop_codon:yes gene_type:complete
MTRNERAKEKALRVQQAMFPLCGDSRFIEFMELVREQRDIAVQDAVTDRVIANERMLSVALGEIRCYESLLSVFENFKQQAEAGQDREEAAE